MKIVNFKGGLGNQIFFYLMCLYLKESCPKNKIYGNYNSKLLSDHNGLEIQNIFDIELPPETIWSKLVTIFARGASRFIKGVKADDNRFRLNAIYYDGWWQDKKYFLNHIAYLKFREVKLDKTNDKLLRTILTTNSVSLHIRRGDYLLPKYKKLYGDICTLQYYQSAIHIIEDKMDEPYYFIFSNDIKWVKKNIHLKHAVFVENNTGSNSYIDMFLMSWCKANIIANSSFSYWGAKLNVHQHQIVVYPKKWNQIQTPDLFPNEWYGI